MLPFALAVGALFSALAAVTGLEDPDFFWHVRVGELIVDQGLPRADLFSFTVAGEPWVVHEWLGETLLYLIEDTIGTAGLIAAWSALVGLICIIVASVISSITGGRTGPIAGAVVAGVGLLPYVSLRPQILSLVLLAALVWILINLRPTSRWLLYTLPVVFVLWANVHGFWSVGLGVLGLYLMATWAGSTPMWPERRRLAVFAAVCLPAVLLNPYGADLLLYPLRYVDSGDWGLANIREWQSPNFHDPAHWPLLAALTVIALLRGSNRITWLEVAAWLALLGSLYALRISPIAAILSGIVIGPSVAAFTAGRAWARLRRPRGAVFLDWAFTGLIVGVSATALVVVAVGADLVDDTSYPVAATNDLKRIDPEAKVMAEYAWSGFLISELASSGGKVFVDGRNDMYPQTVLDDYSAIRAAAPGAERLLHEYGATAVMLPPDAGLVLAGLSPEWCEVHRSDLVVLWTLGTCEEVAAD